VALFFHSDEVDQLIPFKRWDFARRACASFWHVDASKGKGSLILMFTVTHAFRAARLDYLRCSFLLSSAATFRRDENEVNERFATDGKDPKSLFTSFQLTPAAAT
jgi:hypothetical protein